MRLSTTYHMMSFGDSESVFDFEVIPTAGFDLLIACRASAGEISVAGDLPVALDVNVIGPSTSRTVGQMRGHGNVTIVRMSFEDARSLIPGPLHRLKGRLARLDDLNPELHSDIVKLRDSGQLERHRAPLLELIHRHRIVGEILSSDVCNIIDQICRHDNLDFIKNENSNGPDRRRKIQRYFAQHIGISPKSFSMIARIQKARRYILQGLSIASAAHEAGFSDQSHLTRQFRLLTGSSPTRVERNLENVAFLQDASSHPPHREWDCF